MLLDQPRLGRTSPFASYCDFYSKRSRCVH